MEVTLIKNFFDENNLVLEDLEKSKPSLAQSLIEFLNDLIQLLEENKDLILYNLEYINNSDEVFVLKNIIISQVNQDNVTTHKHYHDEIYQNKYKYTSLIKNLLNLHTSRIKLEIDYHLGFSQTLIKNNFIYNHHHQTLVRLKINE